MKFWTSRIGFRTCLGPRHTRRDTPDSGFGMASRVFAAIAIITQCGGMVLCGCAKHNDVAADSAAAAAEAFADALNADDLKRAAATFDYVTSAREQNEDWDDIPSGQRDLIVKKLTEQKAGELAGYRQRLGEDIKCGPVGQGNVVALTGDAGSITVELREREGKWYVGGVW